MKNFNLLFQTFQNMSSKLFDWESKQSEKTIQVVFLDIIKEFFLHEIKKTLLNFYCKILDYFILECIKRCLEYFYMGWGKNFQ